MAVLLVGVLGTITSAQKYGSRMIMAAIPATPIGVLGAFGVGMGILSAGDGGTVALTDDGVLRSVLGMACYLTAIALMGLGLGIPLPARPAASAS